MTNTTGTQISNFSKVSLLVELEISALTSDEVTEAGQWPVMHALVAEGHASLQRVRLRNISVTRWAITADGRDRVAGFRALLAPAE
jgi:hypothetical protein